MIKFIHFSGEMYTAEINGKPIFYEDNIGKFINPRQKKEIEIECFIKELLGYNVNNEIFEKLDLSDIICIEENGDGIFVNYYIINNKIIAQKSIDGENEFLNNAKLHNEQYFKDLTCNYLDIQKIMIQNK